MTQYEMILMAWNVALTAVVFVHALRFALVQKILNSIMNIMLAEKRKSAVDALYGRNNND